MASLEILGMEEVIGNRGTAAAPIDRLIFWRDRVPDAKFGDFGEGESYR